MSFKAVETPSVQSIDLTLEESLLNCLVNLNCHYQKRQQDDGYVSYDFKYQSKIFCAQLGKEGSRLTICYPNFYIDSLDNLNVIRHMCNVFNVICFHHKMYYSIDYKEYKVGVHCDMPVLTALTPDDMVSRIDSMFQIQHDFSLQSDKEISENKGGHFRDFEYQRALDSREVTLSHELEISHQTADVSVRSNEDFSFTVGDFLSIACDVENDPSLSDVDIVFAQLTNGNVGMNFYWGRRCFAQGHYAQALKHFLNAYNIVRYESTSAVSDALSAMCLLLHWILLVWDEKI